MSARRVSRELRNLIERDISRRTIGLTETLTEETPEDTGFAESNWVPSVGTQFSGLAGSKEAVSFAEQQSGIAQMLNYKLIQGNFYITNNVEYVGRLNEGSSTQAPAGFVQAAIARWFN